MNKMKKLKYCFVFISLGIFGISSCGNKIVPASFKANDGIKYDSAAFNYVYVEAIKQKLFGNDADALNYFEQCVKVNPQSDASYYQMAQIVLSSGDTKNAKKYISKALSIDQENIWYLTMIAGVYYKEENLDSAIIYYEKINVLFPEKENVQLTLGNLYAEKKDYDKAISIFDSFDKKYGINESSTISSVRSLMATEKFDEALVKISLLLKEYPDEIFYNGILAEIYRARGENEKALTVYEELIERNPDNAQTQLSLCDFFIKEKNFIELFRFLNTVTLNNKIEREDKIALIASLFGQPEIIRDYSDNFMLALMVIEANFKNDNIFLLFRPELLVQLGKLDEAAVRLEEIIKILPENYYAWEKLLFVYLQNKDYNKLFTKGDECATLFNRSFLAKILYANGAIELKKYSIALEELRKAQILAGENKDSVVQVLSMKADVYYRMKEYAEAFKIFDEARKVKNDDLTVLNNYAYYLAEQNTRLKEAEAMAKKVIEEEKTNTTYLDTYGWVLYKRGKFNAAAEIMQSIINSKEKPDAVWYEHYGYILKKQKKCEEAIKNWNIALKLDSTKSELIKEIQDCEK
jgi:tetratricopeptide (TPR) repeat protein